MSKEELFKKYQEIVLKTNGGADDYVVALCQISNLIKDYSEEKDQQIADLETKLAESEKKAYSRGHSQRDITNEIKLNALREDVANKEKRIVELKQQLAEKEKENKTLKDIRTLERVVPRNAQLNKLSNRDCYLKGFENAISETIRTFEETYGKEKCKLIEERDKYLMDIVKVGGYEYQIEELKQQLAEKEKSLSIKSVVRTLMKDNNLNCTFRDKTNAQIQQCGDVYNSNYGYFNFEDDYDESLNNKTDNRFDITSIDLTNQDKISFAIEQLEKVKEEMDLRPRGVSKGWKNKEYDTLVEEDVYEVIDNQIKQLKEGM